jgi:hypothetical protein
LHELNRDRSGRKGRLAREAVLDLIAAYLTREDRSEPVFEASAPLLVLEGQAPDDLGATSGERRGP